MVELRLRLEALGVQIELYDFDFVADIFHKGADAQPVGVGSLIGEP